MPNFKIEQLALCLNREREAEAIKFLAACGIVDWIVDRVMATGTVHSRSVRNAARLQFNYTAFADKGLELELLQYEGHHKDDNWLGELAKPIVSHIGMHIEESELRAWRSLMAQFGIDLAQEVWTDSHSNPRIANCRRYHYVIYATRELIGVDMKFIVREIIDAEEEAKQLTLLDEALMAGPAKASS